MARPRIYNDENELQEEILKYFEKCNELSERPTVTGLALFLGFASKQSLYDYEKNDKFSYPIKRALTMIECELEKRLENQSVSGIIFALKNMGWTDKVQTEHSGELKQTQIIYQLSSGNEPIKEN
jgi:hypothetical protein